MIAKLDVKPIIEKLKNADIFKAAASKEEATKELRSAKAAELGFEVIAEICSQLDRIADDIPVFIALYKGVSKDEAEDLDFAEVLNEIIHDEGIKGFFSTALRRKVERGA